MPFPAVAAVIGGLGAGASSGGGSSSGGSTGSSGGSNAGWSLGSSAEDSYNYSNEESNSYGYNESWSNQEGESWTDGAAASARDLQYAREANAHQEKMWEYQAAYNAEQAARDREFQAYMSNTSYQRAVADLLKAGLNPILAAGNAGASTPSGAMASAGLASSAKGVAHADSYSYNRGSSGSKAENWSHSKGNSYGESHGRSNNKSQNWGNTWSREESWMESQNNTTNNIREITEKGIEAAKQVGNTAKTVMGRLKNGWKNPFKSGERMKAHAKRGEIY